MKSKLRFGHSEYVHGAACPLLTCWAEGDHSHLVCPICEATRFGNMFCDYCKVYHVLEEWFWDPITEGFKESGLSSFFQIFTDETWRLYEELTGIHVTKKGIAKILEVTKSSLVFP